MPHPYLNNPPWNLDYAGVKWALVHPKRKNQPPRECNLCGTNIRSNARAYRTREPFAGNAGGPDGQTFMHQKCLIGQIWPEVWDIGIPGQ